VSEQGTDLASNELMRVFAAAKAEGCQFTFGTDSHSVQGLENVRLGDAVAAYLGLTPADIADYLQGGVEND
jgi:histidinol phosphatase-like PHP family hydrolase